MKRFIRKSSIIKKAKNFVNISGKTWEELLDNIKAEGYTFDEKLYTNEPSISFYKKIDVSKDGKRYRLHGFINDYHDNRYEIASASDLDTLG